MQATRVIKTIKHTVLDELGAYVGQKVEIIILPLPEKIEYLPEDLEEKRKQFFDIIERYSVNVKPWTREELH